MQELNSYYLILIPWIDHRRFSYLLFNKKYENKEKRRRII